MDWIWYHALPLIVFGVPLIGFLWELLVGLLCRKNCWLLSLPVLAGALGLALCLLAQSSLSLSFLLGFWAAYGCALLFGWSLSQLRTTGDLRWKKWICRGMALCSGAALAVGFGVLILHEMRAANYTMVEEVISEENALSEIPELAITDTDRKILSALEASSSVQAAIGEGDKVTINGFRRNTRMSRRFCQNFWRKGSISFPRSAPSRSSAKSALCTMIFSTGKRASGSLQKS